MTPVGTGARTNPFATRHFVPGAQPYEFEPGTNLDLLLSRWEAAGRVGALVGPHGTGKSTLVATLVAHWRSAGRRPVVVTLHEGARHLPARAVLDALRSGLLVVDGAEQLGQVSRKCLKLLAFFGVDLLVTTHAPSAWPTLHVTRFDPGFVRRLAHRLASADVRGARLTDAVLDDAIERGRGNVREVLFALYDNHERADRPTLRG